MGRFILSAALRIQLGVHQIAHSWVYAIVIGHEASILQIDATFVLGGVVNRHPGNVAYMRPFLN